MTGLYCHLIAAYDIRYHRANTLLQHDSDILVFDNSEYFDVQVTYAKQNSQDIFIKIEVTNRADKPAPITVLPTLWFYNRWAYAGANVKPEIKYLNKNAVQASHYKLGNYYLYFQNPQDCLFTENETNTEKVNNIPNATIFVKDAFNDAVIDGKNIQALRDKKSGTKFSPVYKLKIPAGATKTIYCRFTNQLLDNAFARGFEKVFATRKNEAHDFYAAILPAEMDEDMAKIQRQALAGLLWSKQYMI